MRRALKTTLKTIALLLVAFVAFLAWALPGQHPPMPPLAGKVEPGSLEHDGRTRTWLTYVPARPAAYPALVIVLHGSMGTAAQARAVYGYDFDRLADRDGFVVAYPQGVEGNWNDSRIVGDFPARRLHIDDVGFLQALVDRLVAERGIDRTRVYVTGVSNGGAMVLRLAQQVPRFARAYAAVSSNLGAPGNVSITPVREPVSILLMNGTDDPIVPWNGGEVSLYGVLVRRGRVVSTQASVDYFRGLAGLDGAPVVTRLPDTDASDGTQVVRSLWTAPGKRAVALVTIEGGGHGVPHPQTKLPRLLGRGNRDIRGAEEIWTFFQAAP
jgi:polyhydroxybutyrate depolymerase